MATKINIKLRYNILLFIIAIALMIVEIYEYYIHNMSSEVMGVIMAIFCAFFLLGIAKSIAVNKKGYCDYFRMGGVLIYFIHPYVKFVIKVVSDKIFNVELSNITYFFITTVLSIIVSYAYYELQKKIDWKWMKKLC